MTIRIEGLTGQHKGQVFEFDETKKTILFGRSETADIRFDAGDTSISRHHVSLVFENDRYRIQMQADNPVRLDGEEAFDDDELALGSHTLIVGDAKGDDPTYKVDVSSQDAHMAATDPTYKRQKTARQSAATGFMKVAAVLVILAAVGTTGYKLLFDKASDLETSLSSFSEKFDQVANQPEFRDVLRPLRKSVYLVVLRKGDRTLGNGTAWVVAPGVLATNAHVAEGLQKAMEGDEEMIPYVVSNEGPDHRKHRITDMAVHPHYTAFAEHQRNALAVTDWNSNLNLVPGYDVALLRVEGAEDLAPPLKLAEPSTLLGLDSGEEVGFIGYPLEDAVGGGTNYNQPTPQMQMGAVTSVTDYFMVGGDSGRNHLIQHNLPAHGGASGSPIFNAAGDVVALFNAGNVVAVNGHRIGTGIGVNFGQRVDVLTELLENRVEAITEARTGFWGNRLAQYRTPMDVMLENWRANLSEENRSRIVTLFDGEGELKVNRGIRGKSWRFDVPARSDAQMFVVAQSLDGKDIDLVVANGTGNVLARDAQPNPYPALLMTDGQNFKAGNNHIVVVFGGEVGVTFKIKVYALPR